ncbi:MAG TPA: amidase [Dehalococcoidia bacterium]|nr:amidase [Dehalococcoidia bacterium]
MDDLVFRPAHELAELVRSRQLSPVELMEATLDRIRRLDPVIRAFITLRADEALAEARQMADLIARGEEVGPLAGLPLGVKDLEDVAGLPTTYGSLPFRDNVARRDSVQVERLKRAGAIVVGKTSTPEFGYTFFCRNLLTGATLNPWHLERTPGGSSGGSAAAIAAGMVPLATASDAGGSIRIPAAYTGCFGIKPQFGRVPMGPFEVVPWSGLACYGPITRTVMDAALYLDAVVGDHPSDPYSLPHPGYSYVERLREPLSRLRVAWSPTLGYALVQPDVLRVAESAARVFQDLGHEVEEVEDVFPDPAWAWGIVEGGALWMRIADKVEAHRDQFGRGFLALAERGRQVTQDQYYRAQAVRADLVNRLWHLFERYDLLLTPTTATEAVDAHGRLSMEIAGRPIENPISYVAFTYPFNLSGHPAATVRAGFSDAGLPVGLQIVGPRLREDLVLRAAYAFEQARPWASHWPRELPSS